MNPTADLAPRLKAIFNRVRQIQQTHPSPMIWDCCCDHGYLGIKLLAEGLCDKMVFVDQVPHIIEQLAKKLAPFDVGTHQLIIADAGTLAFDTDLRHLVIISGVGGERTIEIVGNMEAKNPDATITYLFCPSTRSGRLRAYLAEQGFGLLTEEVAFDKRRQYDILSVQKREDAPELPLVPLINERWNSDYTEWK